MYNPLVEYQTGGRTKEVKHYLRGMMASRTKVPTTMEAREKNQVKLQYT